MPKTWPQLPVAALFVSGRSVYKYMPGVLAYDAKSRAETFAGRNPVVAHPPCRTWSKYLRHQAKPLDLCAEQSLAFFALDRVLKNGGVLEQPAGSHFWSAAKLPAVGDMTDPFCYTIQVEQSWFGYRSQKKTWLLVVGVPLRSLPKIPFGFVRQNARSMSPSSAERSRTMPLFADWLCRVARQSWFQHATGR